MMRNMTKYNTKMVFSVAVVLAVLNVIKNYNPVYSGRDYAVLQFIGYGGGYLNLVEFFGLLLVNGIPAYILCVWLGNKSSLRGMVLLRYRSAKKYFLHAQLSMATLAAVEVLALFAVNFLLGGLLAEGVNGGASTVPGGAAVSAEMLCGGMVLRWMELMCVQMLCLLFADIFQSETCAFLAAMSGYVSVIFTAAKWNPFGLSSLCRTAELDSFLERAIPYLIFAGIYLLLYPAAEKMFGTKICERGQKGWKK